MRYLNIAALAFSVTSVIASPAPLPKVHVVEVEGSANHTYTLSKRAGGRVIPVRVGDGSGCSAHQVKWVNLMLTLIKDMAKAGNDFTVADPEWLTYFGDVPVAAGGNTKLYKEIVHPTLNNVYKLLTDGAPGFQDVLLLCPKATDRQCAKTGTIAATVDGTVKSPSTGKTIDIKTISFCPQFWDMFFTPPKMADMAWTGTQRENKIPIYFDNDGKVKNLCNSPMFEGMFGYWSDRFPLRIFFHELTHVDSKDGWAQSIDCVYGAFWSQFIARYGTLATGYNADTYATAVTSKWVRGLCQKIRDPKSGKIPVLKQETPYPGESARWIDQPMAQKEADPRCLLLNKKPEFALLTSLYARVERAPKPKDMKARVGGKVTVPSGEGLIELAPIADKGIADTIAKVAVPGSSDVTAVKPPTTGA